MPQLQTGAESVAFATHPLYGEDVADDGRFEFDLPANLEPGDWVKVTGGGLPQPLDVKFRIIGRQARIVAIRMDNDRAVSSSQLRALRLAELTSQLYDELEAFRDDLEDVTTDAHQVLERLQTTPEEAMRLWAQDRDAVMAGAAEPYPEFDAVEVLTEHGMHLEALERYMTALTDDSDADLSQRGPGATPPTHRELRTFARTYLEELPGGRGAKTRTAKRAGMDRTTVHRWIKRCEQAGLLPKPKAGGQ